MVYIVFEGDKLAHVLLPIDHSLDFRPDRPTPMTPCGIDSDELRDYAVTDQVVLPFIHCPGCHPDLPPVLGGDDEELVG